jgi:ABC-type uncharacterized transport system permease subunit
VTMTWLYTRARDRGMTRTVRFNRKQSGKRFAQLYCPATACCSGTGQVQVLEVRERSVQIRWSNFGCSTSDCQVYQVIVQSLIGDQRSIRVVVVAVLVGWCGSGDCERSKANVYELLVLICWSAMVVVVSLIHHSKHG